MGDDDLARQSSVSSQSRRKSVHQALGGGAIADAVLWKRWSAGAWPLVTATAFWFLFERAGYSPLSLVAHVLFLLVVILFLWAKSASLLNRYYLWNFWIHFAVSIGNFSGVQKLLLDGNMFFGRISPEIGKLQQLSKS